MKAIHPDYIKISPEVSAALAQKRGLVALESTVVTHGLPYPDNIQTMIMLEDTVRTSGAVPATIIVVDGVVHIGIDELLREKIIQRFEQKAAFDKYAIRDLGMAIARRQSGGTTVSATMLCAHQSGIKVFATGGIGGVHRLWNLHLDVSLDLKALATIPVIVVSAGCKAILDIEATVEVLESFGVPVLGWQTDDFPAFYSRSSGVRIPRADSCAEIVQADIINTDMARNCSLSPSGILVGNPIPEGEEIKQEEIEPVIQDALKSAYQNGIKGKDITPYLLSYLARHTDGRSVTANLALLKNNAELAAKLANEYCANT
ncbi:MAG: pseudouridine-5'-phosphate glycosidase [Candidatus Cloacimonadaceae bacterium]|nr:pseudouridine-5'-phosphate glycosidase [Candidatus Cloacimonadaceae bacterium]